jgi:glutathione synthase/RimK-type ligase-like ATP-grasp enzyme
VKRVLITGARAPAALHLARLLHDGGHHVVMADSLVHVISAVSRACAEYVLLPAANGDPAAYEAALRQAITLHEIDLVVPTCEEVFHLAGLWAHHDMGASLYAPDMAMLTRAHDKFAFTELATSLGLAVPETVLLTHADALADVRGQAGDLVFKPVWSRFATQVQIRPREIDIVPTLANPWVAQEYVEGVEICVYAFAHVGRVAGMAAYRSVYRAGKGAGIAFEPDDDPAVADFVARFVEGTGWTGQVSFDLMRTADGSLVALECNPRATSGVHFFRDPSAFADAFLGQDVITPDVAGLQAVKAAMWIYGPWQKPVGFLHAMKRARDVLAWPDDPAPARKQLAAAFEIARIAMRHRVGLVAAATYDIEWNGR